MPVKAPGILVKKSRDVTRIVTQPALVGRNLSGGTVALRTFYRSRRGWQYGRLRFFGKGSPRERKWVKRNSQPTWLREVLQHRM